MGYKIVVRSLAVLEILEAYDWYEDQQEGLGMSFLEELDAFYEVLSDNPFTYSYYEEPVREGVLKRFPYTVVYEVFGEEIVVYSVFMCRQSPDKKRIR